MSLKRVAAVAALAVAGLPLQASAAPAVRMQVWEVVRTSSAPSKLAIQMSVGYSDSRTILALTYLRHDRGGPRVLPGAHLSSDEGTTSPHAYAAGHRVSCPAAGACTRAEGYNLMTAYYNDAGRSDPIAPDRVVVVTYGRDANVTLANGQKQWRVRRVSRTVRAAWSTDGTTAAGVWQTNAGGELFTAASLRGGKRGSVAIGAPPCAGAPGLAVTVGAGSATLTGGVKPVTVTCPIDVARASQVARGATTWNFSGTVAGLTAELVSEPGPVRLLVVDF